MTILNLFGISGNEAVFFVIGALLLILTPPVVGLTFWVVLFRAPLAHVGDLFRRMFSGLILGLGVAFGLGATGVSLLQPASPDVFIALAILCLIFALWGAGKLYW